MLERDEQVQPAPYGVKCQTKGFKVLHVTTLNIGGIDLMLRGVKKMPSNCHRTAIELPFSCHARSQHSRYQIKEPSHE